MYAVILAGGENKRINLQKAFLEIKGKRIIETISAMLGRLFSKVIINTNDPESFFYLGLPMTGDILKARGPMTGILSSMVSADAPEIFVVACDMPFVNEKLVSMLINKYNGQNALVPLFHGESQPLLGIYSKRIALLMEDSISKDERSMKRLLQKIDVEFLEEDIIRDVDPEGRSFVNINTMDDFKKMIGAGV